MDRKTRSGLIDFGLFLAVLITAFCSATRARGEELPEPLRQVGGDWTAEVSPQDKQGHATPIRLANAEVEYVLYSSPQRPLLYSVSHYRVRPRQQTGWFALAGRGDYHGHEALHWFQYVPGEKSPRTRLFVKRPHGLWWTLGLLHRSRWEELPTDSEVWIIERGVAGRVWSVHALIQAHGWDPAKLEF